MKQSDAISAMTERIVRDFDPVKVILFGSWARGDAASDSDVDLLVVLPRITNKRRAMLDGMSALALANKILEAVAWDLLTRGFSPKIAAGCM